MEQKVQNDSENSKGQNAENKTAKTMLNVEEVTSGYGNIEVLFDASIEVRNEEFVVIIGPNGAGKTTLMRSIVGVIEPSKGNVFFEGEEITGLKPEDALERGISYVPQEGKTFPDISVIDNLRMGGYAYKGDLDERLADVYSLFPVLEDRLDQEAGSLSGGQRQMVAIARGLMIDPDFLILDEPTSGLQPSLVTDVLDRIQQLQKEGDITVLQVAQAEEAIPRADRGYLLRAGEVLLGDTTDKLLDREEVMNLYFGG